MCALKKSADVRPIIEKRNGKTIDILYQKRLKKIVDDLSTLLGDKMQDIKKISEIILKTESSIRAYTRKKNSKRINFDTEIYRVEKQISNLQKTLKDSEQSNKTSTYEKFSFINPPDWDSLIPLIKNNISALNDHLKILELCNRLKIKEKTILSDAMAYLFEEGEKFGLKLPGMGAGRGNKNKLFEFIKICTGINDTKEIRRYYDNYRYCQELCKKISG